MPYILKKTNGERLATIADGSLNIDTDLVFVGKNYAGYGEILNQNLVKMLENFSTGGVRPTSPIRGQLWYDYSEKALKVYTGVDFKRLARLEASASLSQPSDSIAGDLWWDTTNGQLKVYNGVNYAIVSGSGSGGATVTTDSSGEVVDIVTSTMLDDNGSGIARSVLKHTVKNEVVAVTANDAFGVNVTDPLYSRFRVIKKGVTLAGSHTTTGVSSTASSYLWGTAADAMRLNGIAASEYLLTANASSITTSSFTTISVTTITAAVIKSTGPSGSVFQGTWTLASATLEASYADVAERYAADKTYAAGTVLTIGGTKEVTMASKRADPAVAGIVSNGYAHLLNAAAGFDATHPPIALAGRVPCHVVGPVEKGDLLVSSDVPGYAERWKPGDSPSAVLGKALKSTIKSVDIIEVKV